MKKLFLNQLAAARRWQTGAVRAFTLTELLVVLTVVAILAAVLLSASFTTGERVFRAECVSNLRQIGIGWNMYHEDFNQMMPCHWPGYASSGGTSNPWRTYEVGRCNVGPQPGGQVNNWENSGSPAQLGPWNLGLLFATGLIPNPIVFYCPSLAYEPSCTYGYYSRYGWPSLYDSSDDKIRTDYNYFPQGRWLTYLGNGHIGPAAGNGGPEPNITPLGQNDIDPNKSIATDLVQSPDLLAHRASGTVAGLNALFPDGRVVFQNARSNPQAFDPALWGDTNNPIGNNPGNFRYVMSFWQP